MYLDVQCQKCSLLLHRLTVSFTYDCMLKFCVCVTPVIAGVAVLQYLQNVSQSLALGAELVYQYGPTVPGRQIAIYTLAGRWTGRSFSASSVFMPLLSTSNRKHFRLSLCVPICA